jgi:hypothetical protein
MPIILVTGGRDKRVAVQVQKKQKIVRPYFKYKLGMANTPVITATQEAEVGEPEKKWETTKNKLKQKDLRRMTQSPEFKVQHCQKTTAKDFVIFSHSFMAIKWYRLGPIYF